MDNLIGSLTVLVITGLVAMFVFLLIRQIMLWYWRVNEIADNLAVIANHYRSLQPNARPANPQPPRGPQAAGVGSPFTPMGNRPNSNP